MNYQKPCVEMDLNNGMFLKNGECGYILKPAVLRDSFSYFNPDSNSTSTHSFDHEAQIIKIKVSVVFVRPEDFIPSSIEVDTVKPAVVVTCVY